jgi:hypothetical protein
MGITLPRSTIKEIITKYKREPNLGKTIFVEGSTDKSLIKWFLKKANHTDVSILSIDTMEVPKNNVESLGLEDNNRNRIITITTLIKNNIIGIIDSDFDFLLNNSHDKYENLCKTDYTDMEMYLYNIETLEKILLQYGESKKAEEFLKFKDILIELFLIAYTKKNKKNELSNIDFVKELSFKSNLIIFNRDKYLSKYLENNKELIKEFNIYIDNIKSTLPSEKRKLINGHDFISLLQFYLNIKHKKEKEIFIKSLYSSLEYTSLKNKDMFKKLLLLI